MSNKYLDIAMEKVIKQEVNTVLEKIRDEIEEVYNDRPRSYNHTQRIELFCKIIEIIDKYKVESEDKESCDNCEHNTDSWDSDACDGCCGANSKWSGEIYPGEFEAMEHNGRLDALESEGAE